MPVRSNRRTLLWLGAAVVAALLVATALPVFAAKPSGAKTIGMSVTPGTVSSGSSHDYTVTLTNTTPGNSNPNSFLITLPDGFDVTKAVYTSGTNPNPAKLVTWDETADTVSVTGLDPLKNNGQTVVITVTATAPVVAGCGSTTALWAVTGYTGTNLTGDTFTRNTSNASVTTTVDASCGLRFNPAPTNSLVDTDIPVTVEVVSGDTVVSSFAGTITLAVTATPDVATVTGAGSVATTDGTADFTLNGDTAGDYTVSASTDDASLGSIEADFTLFGGEIFCQETTEEGLSRGDNKDGSTCVLVDYTFENDGFGDGDVSNDLVTLEWDTVVQEGASFRYTKTWDPEAVSATTGLPTRVTKVAWQKDTNGDWIFVPGRACWDDELPMLYATLDGGIGSTDTSITVAAEPGVPTAPFDVMIGGERVHVSAISGSTWTIVRHVGGTTAATHADGARIMSTPLPLDQSGNIVPMCIAKEGWDAYGPGLVRFTTTVFDIGDGAMKR